MVAIFNYGFPQSRENFEKANVELTTLTNYETAIQEALRIDYIDESELDTLQEWRKSPSDWK
ncbi:MAG TPA: hypothetical protein DIT04_08275 [Dysgonomonas sp.]|nr:hypothetical protein [Dysgonomonas sp.]